jgi:uncharacterized protein YceH (UPF0502 family)
MPTTIDEIEARVLGSLVEKQLTTPEYYPLTLNALTAACNQKSNRDPVMALGETEIMGAIDRLRDKNLVYLFYGSSSRTVKYKHMLPNVFELDEAGVAVMALLMLRGPQTVGELRGRSDRLHEFGGLDEVQATLDELAGRAEPLITRLERAPGQKEARYAHLLCGPVDTAQVQVHTSVADVAGKTDRLKDLELEIQSLRTAITEFRAEFEEFKKQFD